MTNELTNMILGFAKEQEDLYNHVNSLHGLTIGLLDEFDPTFLDAMPSQFSIFELHTALAKYLSVPFPYATEAEAQEALSTDVLAVCQAFLRELIGTLAVRLSQEARDA